MLKHLTLRVAYTLMNLKIEAFILVVFVVSVFCFVPRLSTTNETNTIMKLFLTYVSKYIYVYTEECRHMLPA